MDMVIQKTQDVFLTELRTRIEFRSDGPLTAQLIDVAHLKAAKYLEIPKGYKREETHYEFFAAAGQLNITTVDRVAARPL